jgi:DNA replication and repair protein RecF
MRLRHLQLANYRNIERLDIDLPPGLAVFVGDNAEGKTNLLEAIYLLATMRALRADTDAQLIRGDVLDEVMPAARVVAEADTAGGPVKLEVAVVARPGANGPIATKTVRVNGVARRLSDAMGRLTAVLFTADDLEMLSGSPSLRRRYLDLTLMQLDSQYAGARQRFERVLVQRNHLLKRIREGGARPDELPFWDSELCKEGALLFQRRASAVCEIAALAAESHAALAPSEVLGLRYRPRLDGATQDLDRVEVEGLRDLYARSLTYGLSRDIAAGMTLQGPHRDDLLFSLNGRPASGYASRAQQRTIALSLRLAEARFLLQRRGDAPVLLLDDILSEMDAGRRHSVLAALSGMEQIIVTGTDWDRFPEEFLSGAALFSVKGGCATPLLADPAARRISGS